jgi:hypothetical protein
VPFEAVIAIREAVLEELAEHGLVVREGCQAVADVAGGQDAQVAAQAPGGAAVVGDGDDGGDVARVGLQAAQHGSQAVPAADRDDARPFITLAVGPEGVGHVRTRAHEGADDGAVEHPDAVGDDGKSQDAEDEGAQNAGQEAQGGGGDQRQPPGLGSVAVEVEDEHAQPDADQGGAQQDDQHPALDADAGDEPAQGVGQPGEEAAARGRWRMRHSKDDDSSLWIKRQMDSGEQRLESG